MRDASVGRVSSWPGVGLLGIVSLICLSSSCSQNFGIDLVESNALLALKRPFEHPHGEQRFGRPDDVKLALDLCFERPDSTKLSLNQHFGRHDGAKLPLRRRFGRHHGSLKIPLASLAAKAW